MTYTNDYRLGRRAFHDNRDESPAFVPALAVVLILSASVYILNARFHIRPAQLVELSLYTLYGVIAAVALVWYFSTRRNRRES